MLFSIDCVCVYMCVCMCACAYMLLTSLLTGRLRIIQNRELVVFSPERRNLCLFLFMIQDDVLCVWCIANHWEDIVCLFKNFSQNNHVVTGKMKSTLILFLVLTGLPLYIHRIYWLITIILIDIHQRLTDVRETVGAFHLHFFSCHRMRNSGRVVLFLLGRCTKAHILLHAGLSPGALYLLVSISQPLPQAGWCVPASWRPPLYSLFVFEERECPESLAIRQAHPSLVFGL